MTLLSLMTSSFLIGCTFRRALRSFARKPTGSAESEGLSFVLNFQFALSLKTETACFKYPPPEPHLCLLLAAVSKIPRPLTGRITMMSEMTMPENNTFVSYRIQQ